MNVPEQLLGLVQEFSEYDLFSFQEQAMQFDDKSKTDFITFLKPKQVLTELEKFNDEVYQ